MCCRIIAVVLLAVSQIVIANELSNELLLDDSLLKQHFDTRAEIISFLNGKNLKTERLKISFTTEQDLDSLAKYYVDEEYLRMYDMSSLWPRNIDEAREHLKQYNLSDTHKCFLTIKIKSTGECIGQIGFDFNTRDRLWVCYWLASSFQGKGYMSEIALPLIKYFFITCKEFNMLHIRTHIDNFSSQRLAKKICDFVNIDNKYKFSTYEEEIKRYSEAEARKIHYKVIHFKLFKNKL